MITLEQVESSMCFMTERITKDFFSFGFKRYNGDEIVILDSNNYNLDLVKKITTQTQPNIFVGYNLKYKTLKAYHCALNGGSAKDVYNVYNGFQDHKVNIYNIFNWIDYIDISNTDVNLISANLGLSLDYNKSNNEILMDKLYNLEFIYNTNYNEQIMIRLGFQKYKDDAIWLLRNKNTTILTTLLANDQRVDYDGVGEYFKVPDRFRNYFDRHLPKTIEMSFTIPQVSEFKEFKKENSHLFEIDEFDNPGKTGNGGYHSVHKHLKVFTHKHFDRYPSHLSSILNSGNYYLFHDDGSRYYPSLIQINDLLSRNAKKDVYDGFLEELDWFTINNPKSLQRYNLKIAANSVYGQGGNSKGKIYDPYTQHSITALGQSVIIAYANALFKIGCKIFQCNTDGIYVAVPKTKYSEYLKLQKEISLVSGIKFDSDQIQELYQSNVNNYLKVYSNGEIEVKGSSSSLCGDYKNESLDKKTYAIISKAIYEYLLNGIPVETTIRDPKFDISWYILTSGVSNYDFIAVAEKSNKTYKAADSFNYSNIKLDKINTKGAKINGWDIIYKLEVGVCRLIPVNKNGVKVYQFKDGKSPEVVKSINNHNILLTKHLSIYNRFDFDIDYEFLIMEANKRLDKLFN